MKRLFTILWLVLVALVLSAWVRSYSIRDGVVWHSAVDDFEGKRRVRELRIASEWGDCSSVGPNTCIRRTLLVMELYPMTGPRRMAIHRSAWIAGWASLVRASTRSMNLLLSLRQSS